MILIDIIISTKIKGTTTLISYGILISVSRYLSRVMFVLRGTVITWSWAEPRAFFSVATMFFCTGCHYNANIPFFKHQKFYQYARRLINI